MSDRELLELPGPFRGLPYARKLLAFDAAEAMLPGPSILSHLGTAVAEQALLNAAAHWLTLNGDGDTSTASTDAEPARTRSTTAKGYWSASEYGEVVATILDRLPRASGRSRHFPTIG